MSSLYSEIASFHLKQWDTRTIFPHFLSLSSPGLTQGNICDCHSWRCQTIIPRHITKEGREWMVAGSGTAQERRRREGVKKKLSPLSLNGPKSKPPSRDLQRESNCVRFLTLPTPIPCSKMWPSFPPSGNLSSMGALRFICLSLLSSHLLEQNPILLMTFWPAASRRCCCCCCWRYK